MDTHKKEFILIYRKYRSTVGMVDNMDKIHRIVSNRLPDKTVKLPSVSTLQGRATQVGQLHYSVWDEIIYLCLFKSYLVS